MRCPKCHFILLDDKTACCSNCGTDLTPSENEIQPEMAGNDITSPDSDIKEHIDENQIDKISEEQKATPGMTSDKEGALHQTTVPPEEADGAEKMKMQKKGGFFRRSCAFIVDYAFILLLFTPLSLSIKFGVLTGARALGLHKETFFTYQESMIKITICILIAFYFVYFHYISGATPGKWLFHLKVVKINGKPLGLDTSIIRFLAYFVSLFPFSQGFILIGLHPQKQGLHDIIARTYVIRSDGSTKV